MKALLPFWRYYGGKYRTARLYPAPQHRTIIEPLAGAAGYSLRYPDRDVLLIDRSDAVCGTWEYLIGASAAEILALPDLRRGMSVDEHTQLPQEARWLMGWWCNNGLVHPCKSPSSWAALETAHHKGWNTLGRARCAAQVEHVRHWRVQCGDYRDAPDIEATWFVDPPYQGSQGSFYPHGSGAIDYAELAAWCRDRDGQTIVCDAQGAMWLPFEPLSVTKGMSGKHRTGRSPEAIWCHPPRRDEGGQGLLL